MEWAIHRIGWKGMFVMADEVTFVVPTELVSFLSYFFYEFINFLKPELTDSVITQDLRVQGCDNHLFLLLPICSLIPRIGHLKSPKHLKIMVTRDKKKRSRWTKTQEFYNSRKLWFIWNKIKKGSYFKVWQLSVFRMKEWKLGKMSVLEKAKKWGRR